MNTIPAKEKYLVVGLMSGTSLDGVDIAYVEFQKADERWTFELQQAETMAYDTAWRDKLLNANNLIGEELQLLHTAYGKYLGQLTKAFIAKHRLKPHFISSHGHTIFHQPHKAFTYQLGEGASLAATAECTVVCDFRSMDIALGGQGAPLVPIGDRLLFKGYTHCLNLGGIANISFEENGNSIAFDICPANMALNYLANQQGFLYDDGGKLSASGQLNEKLLAKLNGLDYYTQIGPKSLGREWFEQCFLPLLSADIPLADLMRTCVEHIAQQIVQFVHQHQAPKVLVTGGGARNSFLIQRMEHMMPGAWIVPDEKIVDFKEALIFAFLGVLRMRGEVNSLSSVTGASKDSSGGAVFCWR